MYTKLFVVLIIIGYTLARSCPNNCSGFGTCNTATGQCACQPDRVGVDCSIGLKNVTVGATLDNQQVQSSTWLYYALNKPANGGNHPITVTVIETNANGDADMYIRRGDLPSLSEYDWRDISIKKNFSILLPAEPTQTYYVGIFGFRDTNFKISFHSEGLNGGCPDNCNGHGTCVNNRCVCTGSWEGENCTTLVQTVQVPISQENVVLPRSSWNYFKVHATTNELIWTVNELPSSDVDLYVKKGGIPTRVNFDYAETGVHHNFTLRIVDVAPNTWVYFAFYAFRDAQFSWSLASDTAAACAAKCSLHGRCILGNTCGCSGDYRGADCEQMTRDMFPGETVRGYVDNYQWNYYSFLTDSVGSIIVRLQHSAGDCDLYVRNGTNPTRFEYSYRDLSLNNSVTLVIPDPGAKTWKIGVYGFRECTYNMTVNVDSSCPQQCVHGTCEHASGLCHCEAGWAGDSCTIAVPTLVSNQNLRVTVNPGQWLYYRLPMSYNATAFNVVVKETETVGSVWLFADYGFYPDLRIHTFKDIRTNTNIHRIKDSSPYLVYWGDLYIGVYGSPFLLNPTTVNLYNFVPAF